MPASSIVQRENSVPFVKYELFIHYRGQDGVFSVTDNVKRKTIRAEVGGDSAQLKARASEFTENKKSITVVVAALRENARVDDGAYELISQDYDSTPRPPNLGKDLIGLRPDFRTQPSPKQIGTFKELFGMYDQVTKSYVGGQFDAPKRTTVFSCVYNGRFAKLELEGATAQKCWREAAKNKDLYEADALTFTALDKTVKAGVGNKSKVVHLIDVDIHEVVSSTEMTMAEDLRSAVTAERAAYQAQLAETRGLIAPVAAQPQAVEIEPVTVNEAKGVFAPVEDTPF